MSLYPLDEDDLDFRVELWKVNGAGIERVLAACADLDCAHAAFEAAVLKHPPSRNVTLRQKTRVLLERKGDAVPILNARPEPRA